MSDSDFALALQLQSQFFDEQGADQNGKPPQDSDKPMSLVDPFWELTDPTPDMRALFLEFNDKYFWGRLAGVEVKWSSRMTLCAGLCRYEGRGGLCGISLSVPLLKLRPRKDLIETLLHEMIHAYLFVTDNNKDHDGHGPEFHKHMYRLNNETGTNITVYHNFHDEVNVYKQHWWKCNGPCQTRKPYFGYVKRSMNRAPSKNDRWWVEHERTCGGTYTKVKEPEGYGKKKTKSEKGEEPSTEKGSKVKPGVKSMDIRSFAGEGKQLGKPNNSDTKKGIGKTTPTATITSGVLARPVKDANTPWQNKDISDKNKSNVSNEKESEVGRINSLPGASTPTKGAKNKPVSQGGNVPFSKVKKKSLPVLNFSDSDSDDELFLSVNQVNSGNLHMVNTKKSVNETKYSNDSFTYTEVESKSERTSDIVKGDNVDVNDVRAMLRKVWGQKEDKSKKTRLQNLNNTSVGQKRESSDTDAIPSKRLKLYDSGNKISSHSSNTTNVSSHQDEINASTNVVSVNSGGKEDASEHISRFKVVTSPIEKLFNKIKNKQKQDISSSSRSSESQSSVINQQTNCDKVNAVISSGVETSSSDTSQCPVCNQSVPVSSINDHLDLCLTLKAIS